jgi:hypothetical protein
MESLDDFENLEERSAPRICGIQLHATIANGDFNAFENLLKQGSPMEAKNCHGLTPLQVLKLITREKN